MRLQLGAAPYAGEPSGNPTPERSAPAGVFVSSAGPSGLGGWLAPGHPVVYPPAAQQPAARGLSSVHGLLFTAPGLRYAAGLPLDRWVSLTAPGSLRALLSL